MPTFDFQINGSGRLFHFLGKIRPEHSYFRHVLALLNIQMKRLALECL